ncbi:MAG: hypothetical protein RLZZ292_2682, partial [Bacteroidota bacterium]
QSLFTFIKKTNLAQNHKTDWQKTIRKKTPIFNDDTTPIYVETLTKSKAINVEEELIILYFSVLYDLQQQFFFRLELPPFYTILKGVAFEKATKNALKTLKNIRSKYYADKLLRLWKLLYAYFEQSEKSKQNKKRNEWLLVRDFNIVFEDMMDDLLGENDLPNALKEHKDGKRLDHIYSYQDLLSQDQIYYIGDSKYYKDGAEFSQNSKYKQFTYSKNVIQYNIDLLNATELAQNIRYRDDLTEGYNVTPNFFISAVVEESIDFLQHHLTQRTDVKERNSHFKNRLFDRDTLHLQAYDIHFLFVLHAYIAKNNVQKQAFSQQTKQLFRQNLITYLNETYDFYVVTPIGSIETFVETHFKRLNGKIYRPSSFENCLLLALEKTSEKSNEILVFLESEEQEITQIFLE